MLLLNICLLVAAVLTPPSLRWLYSTHLILLCLYQIFRKDWRGLILISISLVSLIINNIWQEKLITTNLFYISVSEQCWFSPTVTESLNILVKTAYASHEYALCQEGDEPESSLKVKPSFADPFGDYRQRLAFAKHVDALVILYGNSFEKKVDLEALTKLPSWRFAYSIVKGDRSTWSQRDRWLINYFGITHLFVVSGLHIGFVCILALFLSQCIWKVLTNYSLLLSFRRAHLDILIASPMVFGYAIWSGAGEPVIRAAFMVLVVLSVRGGGLQTSVFKVLQYCGWGMLLYWPGKILDPSFWLSFSFVALICLLVNRIAENQFKLKFMKMQFLLSAFAMLLLFGWQNELSVLTILINLVMVPFVAFVWFPITWLALLEYLFFQSAKLYEVFDWLIVLSYSWLEPFIFRGPSLLLQQNPSTWLKVLLLVLAYYFVLWLPSKRGWVGLLVVFSVPLVFTQESQFKRVWNIDANLTFNEWVDDGRSYYFHSSKVSRIDQMVFVLNPSDTHLAQAAIRENWQYVVLLNSRIDEQELLRSMGVKVLTIREGERVYFRFSNGLWKVHSSDCYHLLNVWKTVACENAELLESVLNYSALETGGLGVRAF